MAEAPSKGTSTSGVKPEPTHTSSEEDEDSEIPLCPRSRRTKGPAVDTVEGLSEETVKRQLTGDESVPTLVSTRIASIGSLQSQEKSIDPNIILPGSLIKMMPSAGVPEQSPTIRLVKTKLSVAGVLPIPVSSSSSSEKLDY